MLKEKYQRLKYELMKNNLEKNFFLFDEKNYEIRKKSLIEQLEKQIALYQKIYHCSEIVCLGIGTNKFLDANFDTFGPRVNSNLKKKELPDFVKLYGTMEQPLHAGNIEPFCKQQDWKQKLVLVCDSAVATQSIGCVQIKDQGVFPGLGFDKKLPFLGDFQICFFIQNPNIDLLGINNKTIYQMSEITSDLLYHVFQRRNEHLKKKILKKG